MARILRDEDGNIRLKLGEDEDQEQMARLLQTALSNPAGLTGASRIDESGRVNDAEGNPLFKSGQWGSAGYSPEELVTIGGKDYVRLGNADWGKNLPENLNQYVQNNDQYGPIVPKEVVQYAAKFNKSDPWGNLVPSLLMGLAGPFGLAGAHAAATGVPGLLGSLGQGLGLTQGSFPVGMTGAEIAGLREAAPGMLESIMNPPGAESAVSGWEQTIPGTTTEGVLPGAVGDPFIDAYTPIGTGGGPTGLALPGAAAGAAGAAGGIAKQGAASAAGTWLAKQIKDATGQDVDPGLIDLIGKGAGVGLGVYSANQQADRSQALNDQIVGMAERDRADRMPFLNQSSNWLTNPADFWSGPAAQEIARQTGRVIGGARGENLFDNPTGQSLVMQSLAPIWLNAVTQTANLGLRNTAPLSELGGMGLQNIKAQGAPGAALGAGISDIFNPAGSLALGSNNDILRQLLMRQSGGGTTALS